MTFPSAVAYRQVSLVLKRPSGVKPIRVMCSTCTAACWSVPPAWARTTATAPHRLPIIETQAGDVSAYIPTNVISITDGQIFLEGDLFYQACALRCRWVCRFPVWAQPRRSRP